MNSIPTSSDIIETIGAEDRNDAVLRRLENRVQDCYKEHVHDADEASAEFTKRMRTFSNGNFRKVKDAYDNALRAVRSVQCAYDVTRPSLPEAFPGKALLPALEAGFLTGNYQGVQSIAADIHEHAKQLKLDSPHATLFTRYAGSVRGPVKDLRNAIEDAAAGYALWWNVAASRIDDGTAEIGKRDASPAQSKYRLRAESNQQPGPGIRTQYSL